ncbi:MAG: DHH family phosphoesterase [Patescibacteria group bacterium]|jgi:phosphoesterase RecJ-like protein
MNLQEKLQLAYAKMQGAKRILVIGHTSPDADAIASIGAILEIAANLGLESYAYADKKPAGAYHFIPNEGLIVDEEPADLLAFDLIFILDCGSISRTGLEARIRTLIKAAQEGRVLKRPYLIEFDHHQPQETYADLEVRLPDKASTTEIIYHFLQANNLTVSKSLANCILIGLMTDTGHFLHANSSREAISVSSEMLLRGASLPKIINYTVNNKSFSALKVWGRALENMQFNQETGLVSSALTAVELAELLPPEENTPSVDLFGDIVSFLSALSGVRVALFLREEEGRVKGSLRTNSEEINVARIAQNWGGGGHKKAAGFSLAGHLVKTEGGWKVARLSTL